MQTSAAGLKPQTEELNGWKDTEMAKEKEHYRQNTGMVECGTHMLRVTDVLIVVSQKGKSLNIIWVMLINIS